MKTKKRITRILMKIWIRDLSSVTSDARCGVGGRSTRLSALFTLTSSISGLDLAVDTQGVDGETLDDGIHDTVVKCQRTVDPLLFNDLDVFISHFWQLAHPTATAGASCAKVSQLI